MKTFGSNYTTGIFGIALYLLVLVEIALYFVYTPTQTNTPPHDIIIARVFVDMFVCLGLIGFFSGFRDVIAPFNNGWLNNFIFSCGLAFAVVALVADSIQIGSMWAAGSADVNPTWVGSGGDGSLLIYGPINRLLTMAISISGGAFIIRTRIVSRWIGWMGLLVGLYQLVFVLTIFYMTTPLDFFSVNGWNIPIAAQWFFLWLLVVSIALMRKK